MPSNLEGSGTLCYLSQKQVHGIHHQKPKRSSSLLGLSIQTLIFTTNMFKGMKQSPLVSNRPWSLLLYSGLFVDHDNDITPPHSLLSWLISPSIFFLQCLSFTSTFSLLQDYLLCSFSYIWILDVTTSEDPNGLKTGKTATYIYCITVANHTNRQNRYTNTYLG